METNWIAVDWGTTNFRAFLMSVNGECIDTIEQPRGLLSVEQGQYPSIFDGLIERWTQSFGSLPVIMAGMVGSQQGWLEVPYVCAPASVNDLLENIHEVELLSGNKGKIVSGVSYENGFGSFEVMRGEEVQLIGLSEIVQHDFTAILYGTHSKHAYWRNGKLDRYSTIMTGELYSILTEHSILSKSLPEQKFNEESFIKGIDIGKNHPLNHVLFSARTLRLFNEIEERHVHCYISGMLIGHEFSCVDASEKLYLIGSKKLSDIYTISLTHLNIKFEVINGDDCFLKGMNKIYNNGNNNE